MTGRRLPLRRLLTFLAGLIPLFAPAPAPAEGSRAPDCGTMSLYVLLRLAGNPADLDRISSRLTAATPSGSSMRELRDAARGLGVELSGVRLKSRGRFGAEYALVYLDRGDHGHYVVVRPVGHTGRLVQVLDPNRAPTVVELDELRRAPDWTGLALVPARRGGIAPRLGVAMLGLVVPGLGLTLARRLRARRKPLG